MINTLLPRVFKAKYYPRGEFINGRLGHNASFVWRSLLAAQPLLRVGLRWRVRNGRGINV